VKRAFSIGLLFIFCFNVGGYYVALWALRLQAGKALISRLDAGHYTSSETVELKFPLGLPYPLQQHDFERIDGKFEHGGEYYRLVKHKLVHDTLYVLCVKDQHEKQLVKTVTDYVKMVNALPASAKKALHFFGKSLHDFKVSEGITLVTQAGRSIISPQAATHLALLTTSSRIPVPPPEA
jgi:hypothetical protein